MSKIKKFLSLFILMGIALNSFAQVDQGELENLPPVVFINYEGPYYRIDTREQIRQLGVVLGRQIAEREGSLSETLANMSAEERRNYTYKFEVGPQNRYFVIHCVSGPEGNKLDADIFGLGVDTAVDHIRNLRWIIQGYLQNAYDYSERDAAVLAEYITIYNAVYRGNWDFFTERYKTQVIDNLIRDRAGLSIRYDEWPGRTMMLIPLGHGGLSSIDTEALTDRRVIEELRREDDQGVPQRQEMVDLIERQAEEAERQALEQREQIRREEERLAEERRQADEQRRQAEEERRRAEEDRRRAEEERRRAEEERQRIEQEREAGRISEEEARRQEEEVRRQEEEARRQEEEAARREQEAAEREREAEERERQAEERDRELDEQREEAQRLEDYAEDRYQDAQEQREEIARDQQAAIVQETVGGVFGVTIEKTEPTQMGRIVRLNPQTREELRRSPLDTIHTRTVTFISGKIIAIAGENIGNRAVRLVEVNQINLEMVRQGEDDIMPGSLLWVNGSDLYAITIDLRTNQCFLGRFDTNLVLQARSAVRVHPECSVSIQQGSLLTQREDGSPLILNPMTLAETR